MNFDFSQWHPLDHWPGSARCRQHFGSWQHHLVIAWEYRRRDQVVGWFARWTTCLLGRHHWWIARIVHKREASDEGLFLPPKERGAPGDYRAVCSFCGKVRTATEDEWW